MSFAENLKQIRKERDISQEELAELLTASRQAVSKWEQGAGYPEMEKMILLSEKLNVSLDELVFGQRKSGAPSQPVQPSGRIMIKSADGKQIVNCRKVLPSPVFRRKRKNVPQCALYGVDNVSSLWGENKGHPGLVRRCGKPAKRNGRHLVGNPERRIVLRSEIRGQSPAKIPGPGIREE